MTGVLIYNDTLNMKKLKDIHNLYLYEAASQNIDLKLCSNVDIIIQGLDNINADFILFLDKDIYLAKELEYLGYRVFNKSSVIDLCDSKIKTYQALKHLDIKIPKTIVGPKIFNQLEPASIYKYGKYVVEALGDYVVTKDEYGSWGEQVVLTKGYNQLVYYLADNYKNNLIHQEFITTSVGRDARVQVIGHKVVAAMLRKSNVDFRANLSNGGKGYSIKLSDEFIRVSELISRELEADFLGIDFMFGYNNEPVVCEVNSNMHIKNIQQVTGINIAEKILKYIKGQL